VKPLPFQKDSGGRWQSQPAETRDCSVRALTIAADISYTDAHRALERRGRKFRKGFSGFKLLEELCKVHHFQVRFPIKATLGSEWPKLQAGRFVIFVSGHFFAVVNGVVRDESPQGSRRKIKWICEAPPWFWEI
jgi:hypothetical protein